MSDWWGPYIGLRHSDLHCWGLVRRVYADRLGVELPAFADIPPRDYRAVIGVMDRQAALWAEADGSQPLDVVLMRAHRRTSHVGIITRPGWVLHTEEETDAVHESLRSLAGRVIGFRRLPA